MLEGHSQQVAHVHVIEVDSSDANFHRFIIARNSKVHPFAVAQDAAFLAKPAALGYE